MKKRIEDVTVLGNHRLNGEYFVLEVLPAAPFEGWEPGNFAEIRVDGSPSTFLRRPISIYDVDPETGAMKFLIQIVGEGTRHLSLLKEGENLNLIYPLGNSFSLPAGGKVLLAGGGVGVAPLMFLGRVLRQHGIEPVFILGFRTSDLVVERERFEAFGRVHITTDDGSEGVRGFVTGHPVWEEKGFSMVYACGPGMMMKAVAGKSKGLGIPCEVSLENTMACGFGACLCCVQKTVRGNHLVCTDGPVFNAEDLVW